MSLRRTFGRACLETRIRLDLTQEALGQAVGVSRGYIGKVERGEANLSLELLERISDRLGLQPELLLARPQFLSERRPQDLVHGYCLNAVARRLQRNAWHVAREVEVSEGRVHAWIDILAFDERHRTLLVIEVKTRLDNLGAVERQIGWYERRALAAARQHAWLPVGIGVWLIALASDEVDHAILDARTLFDAAFPGRADHMLDVASGSSRAGSRSVGLIDPRSRRARWLVRTRLDGRRSPLPYRDYADAARRLRRCG